MALTYPAFSCGEEGEQLLQLRPGEVSHVLLSLATATHDGSTETVFENLLSHQVFM